MSESSCNAAEISQVGNVSVIVPRGKDVPPSDEIAGPKFVLDLSSTSPTDSLRVLVGELSRRAAGNGDRLVACGMSPMVFTWLGELSNEINIVSTQGEALTASAPVGIPNRTVRCPTRGCDTAIEWGGGLAVSSECPECRARIRFVAPPMPLAARVRSIEFETYSKESARITDRVRYFFAECVGRLDLFAAEQLEKAVLCIAEPRRVLLSLSSVREVTSGGLEVLNRLAAAVDGLCIYDPYPQKLTTSQTLPGVSSVEKEYLGSSPGNPLPILADVTVQLVLPSAEAPPPVKLPSVSSSNMPRRRRLEVEDIGDITVVNFVDKKILDEQNIQMIGEELFRLVMELGRRKVLLNFGNVEFQSSAAGGKLIALHRMLQAVRGKLVLCKLAKDIFDVFKITKLDKILTVVSDEQEALQRF